MTKKIEIGLSDQVAEWLEGQEGDNNKIILSLLHEAMVKARGMSWQAKDAIEALRRMNLRPDDSIFAQTLFVQWTNVNAKGGTDLAKGLEELEKVGVIQQVDGHLVLIHHGYDVLN